MIHKTSLKQQVLLQFLWSFLSVVQAAGGLCDRPNSHADFEGLTLVFAFDQAEGGHAATHHFSAESADGVAGAALLRHVPLVWRPLHQLHQRLRGSHSLNPEGLLFGLLRNVQGVWAKK